MSANDKWTVRLLRDDEGAAFHRLSVACFGEGSQSEAFIQKRFCNGSRPGAGVVVADLNGQLIGAQAVTLLHFMVGGREELAGMFTDGMTHPDHRRKGIFQAVLAEAERWAFERGVGFLFTMPNDRSLPSFRKSPRWEILPDRMLVARVLDVAGLLKDRGMPSVIAKGTGVLTQWALRNGANRNATDLREVDDLTRFAAEIDALAERTLPEYSVACSRKHAFLEWRFAKNPTWRYRYFVATDAAGKLAAYLVTVNEKRMGTTISYAADMLWANEHAMVRLLDYAAAAMKQSGARLFGSIVSSSRQLRMLKMAGLRQVSPALSKRSFHTAYAVHPERPDVAEIARNGDGWFLSLADFDTI